MLKETYVNKFAQTPDVTGGEPSTSQFVSRCMVLYYMASLNLYMLAPLDGPDTFKSGFILGCDNGFMSPYGGGVHGGGTLAPGTRVLVLMEGGVSGYANYGSETPVFQILAVDNGTPASDTYYYWGWRMLPSETAFMPKDVDSAIWSYQQVAPTDRLRGRPWDACPGDWEVGNPLKSNIHVGGSHIGMEASPVAGLHMYPDDSTVVLNKGLLSVEDHPWSRRSESLDVDGLSLVAEHSADTMNDAMGHEAADTTTFAPNTLEPAKDTQIVLDQQAPRWSRMDYRGLSVGGDVRQDIARPGTVQPSVFSFNGVDGTFLRGGMNSVTLMRSPDLPYLQMLRELDSEEPEEDAQPTSVEDDPSTVDMGDYATQYADLMYELMKRRFVERYWAKQKARGRDWRTLSMSEVAEAMSRNPDGLSLSPIDPDEPAYKDDSFTIADPIGRKDLKLSKLESYIHLSPTGAIVISDGTGSEIRMEGGNIILSPAVDIRVQPGRDMTMTVPRFLSMFAKDRVDLASDKGEIAIHADGNATLSSENGVAVVESRSTSRAESADYDKRGQGGGVVIRSATDAHVVGANVRLALQSSYDSSRQGVGIVPDGMVIIDAGDSPVAVNGRTLSLHGADDATISVRNDGTGLMLGGTVAGLSAGVIDLSTKSVIIGGKSEMKWIDTQNRSMQSATYPAQTDNCLYINGNVVAAKAVLAQTVAGSRGFYRALSSFNGKPTESLFIPDKMKSKYGQTIDSYAYAAHDWQTFTTDMASGLVSSWFTRNASNPMLTADGVKRLGIYYPKSADYHQDNMFWTQSRWQRLLDNTGTAWSPTPIDDADGQPMLPLPGYDGWTRNGFVKGWNADGEVQDSTLSNWVTNNR